MSCSKIFSGDLTELTYEVIKYFQNDLSTLHSCILVNRLCLNDDFKINKYKIINKSSHSNILFNYPRFLKYLNTNEFIFSVDKWYKLVTSTTNSEDIVTDLKKLTDICVSLFKIFIENEVNLHTLEIEISSYQTCFSIIFDELILKNTNFIHNIRNLNLYYVYNYKENSVIKNRISQMINLQQNLKKILISDRFSLYRSLLLSKDYNCSNTLNTIIFYCVDFKGINNLKTVFEQLNVLESIHIFYCYSLNNSFTQQIIDLTKPFKLKSLFTNEISQIESFQLLLQKSGEYLENFGDEPSSSNQQILELITKYCKNIKFLDFHGTERQNSYQIINLIENIKQNLNYLSFNIIYDIYDTEIRCTNSIILQILGQALPSKLEYLCLNIFQIKVNDFEVFLRNSMGTFIKKLLIYNSHGQRILPLIKTYIMKKKRVKYLAINESLRLSFSDNVKELISLEDEVNEFKLYNIEVQSYSGLLINSCDYVKEIN
ncbi:hypothetical protein GLOIN_2v1871562 [Rhizophagus irregularis DAOM 181602=DAOM 197198]|nr:hypothetical protein RhiirB3_440627 [Rhizophagus irregularis]GBC33844.2 hypothetical protein GLOIN_2v1871562 [Rhizophagus irregularis DAOM 181602=DAOM 197198]